jgi:hypothetical protein
MTTEEAPAEEFSVIDHIARITGRPAPPRMTDEEVRALMASLAEEDEKAERFYASDPDLSAA